MDSAAMWLHSSSAMTTARLANDAVAFRQTRFSLLTLDIPQHLAPSARPNRQMDACTVCTAAQNAMRVCAASLRPISVILLAVRVEG